MGKNMRMAAFPALLCVILLQICLQSLLVPAYGQQISEIRVEKTWQVEVKALDAQGSEVFGLNIQNNGGISELRISGTVVLTEGGNFIWNDDWGQTWGSDATADPVVETHDNYVKITCHGKYRVHKVAIVTEFTITKSGLIVVTSTMEAEQNEPSIVTTAWLVNVKTEVFGGTKAYVKVGDTINEASLPVEFTGTISLFSGGTPVWVDFSFSGGGLTMINLDPTAYLPVTVQDERQWGTGFTARLQHGDWGTGAMSQGAKRTTKVALLVHGPGGYQAALNTINFFSDVGSTKSSCESGVNTFKDSRAKDLASQALVKANSAYDKFITGDTSGARADLTEASNLLKQAQDAEQQAIVMRDVMMFLVPIIVLVIIYVIVVMVRKKAKG
jgi:hypothetical protein